MVIAWQYVIKSCTFISFETSKELGDSVGNLTVQQLGLTTYSIIWGFPKIWVPPNQRFVDGCSIKKTIWGYHHLWKPPYNIYIYIPYIYKLYIYIYIYYIIHYIFWPFFSGLGWSRKSRLRLMRDHEVEADPVAGWCFAWEQTMRSLPTKKRRLIMLFLAWMAIHWGIHIFSNYIFTCIYYIMLHIYIYTYIYIYIHIYIYT